LRRYAVVQKSRDADVFGILVGTLGVASYLPLISHIRKLLLQARKKSYTISVGKLNPAKLANFSEIECFVLVACPENSLIDSKVTGNDFVLFGLHTLTKFFTIRISIGLLSHHMNWRLP
jgi:diphthamide biosynthesis enzyme Dph1/Dph2-like protein